MEAATVARPPEAPEESHDGAAEATRSAEELFQWSAYVHVGAGADECEHAIDGRCSEKQRVLEDGEIGGHFHAWVCLPNQFQIRDIAEKARAARARKVRALRDPESDSNAVLEAELEEVRRDHYGDLLTALADQEVEGQVLEIMNELEKDERFENHQQDMEELNRLRELPHDKRDDPEEFERLQKDAVEFTEALESRIGKARDIERTRLEQMAADDVMEMERKRRIDAIATEAYLHAYYTWTMYVGSRRPTTEGMPMQRVFKDPNDLKFAPDVIVKSLREKITELEQRTLQRGDAAGN